MMMANESEGALPGCAATSITGRSLKPAGGAATREVEVAVASLANAALKGCSAAFGTMVMAAPCTAATNSRTSIEGQADPWLSMATHGLLKVLIGKKSTPEP